MVPFPVACGHCFYCDHQEFSQCDNTNEYGEAGGLLGYSKSYGDIVVVLGCGPVGLLTIKWCIKKGAKRVIAVDRVGYRLEHAKSYGAEVLNFEEYDETGAYIKEITSGGADAVIDCVGLDGKMSFMEKVETALKLQGGSKSAIEIASQWKFALTKKLKMRIIY